VEGGYCLLSHRHLHRATPDPRIKVQVRQEILHTRTATVASPVSPVARSPPLNHLPRPSTRKNGRSRRRSRQCRHQQAQRPRQARAAAIRYERVAEGADPVVYVIQNLPSLFKEERYEANFRRSDTLPHRYMLPKVHTRGQCQERQAGQIRRAVHEAMC
jgi:hypothetical protein